MAEYLQEMKTFIFSQNIDISFVSETHFTNKSYFRIPVRIRIHYITECILIAKPMEKLLLL